MAWYLPSGRVGSRQLDDAPGDQPAVEMVINLTQVAAVFC